MIDNRLELPKKIQAGSAFMTDVWDRRRWLILLENDPESDFKMVYYNSDGSQRTHVWKRRKMFGFRKKLKSDWKQRLRLML
jgi:diaminopimelate epimerase